MGAARKQVLSLLGDVHKGIDLSVLRSGNRARPTMASLCECYLRDHAVQHKKASSAAEDRRNIDNHVIPLLGSKLITEVGRTDIDAFKRAVRDGKSALKPGKGPRSRYRGGAVVSGGPGVANRYLALLSKMFNLGLIRKKWRDFLIALDATGVPDGQTRATDLYGRVQTANVSDHVLVSKACVTLE